MSNRESTTCGPDCVQREFARYFENTADRFRTALEAISGPTDSGPFIEAYRAAGGGYAGLQAIAREALGE